MANFTKQAILQTFYQMLVEMPLDKVTVSALVARCGLSSNTFYYHFQDIYDLLETLMDQKLAEVRSGGSELADWTEDLRRLLHMCQDNPKPVYHVVNSLSRERLERYCFDVLEPQFYDFVRQQTQDLPVPEEKLQWISGFFCYSVLGFLMKFLWGNMSADVDKSIDQLSELYALIIDSMRRQFIQELQPPNS